DARDARLPVVYVNPAFTMLTGCTAGEVVGRPWRLLERSERAELGCLQAAIERAEPVDIELKDVHHDGSVWPSRISVSPLHDASGKIRYFLVLQRKSPEPTADGTNPEM